MIDVGRIGLFFDAIGVLIIGYSFFRMHASAALDSATMRFIDVWRAYDNVLDANDGMIGTFLLFSGFILQILDQIEGDQKIVVLVVVLFVIPILYVIVRRWVALVLLENAIRRDCNPSDADKLLQTLRRGRSER